MPRALLVDENNESLPVSRVTGVKVHGTVETLGVSATSPTDLFGRVRVSEPTTVFGSKQTIDNNPLVWDDQQTSGAGTSTTWASARSRLAVSNLTAGTRVRQTFRSLDYQPGKCQQILITAVPGASATGITRRIGQFDANNGIFLEVSPTDVAFVIRKAGVDGERVAQADWSENTLPALDTSKNQIIYIAYEWLGVGTVEVGFVIEGTLVVVHKFHHANETSGVYMETPILPLRYEIRNDGTGGAASLDAICASVASEGGIGEPGTRRVVDRGTTPLTTLNDGDLYPLIVIRKQSTKLRSVVRPGAVDLLCASTALYRWAVILNPTFSGTALSYSAVANSPVEAATPGNGTKVTGGTVLASGYMDAGNQGGAQVSGQANDIEIGSTIAGVSDVIAVCVQRITGTTESFYASLRWYEGQ